MGSGIYQQCVTVGVGFRDRCRAETAAGAAAIFHHDGLPELTRQGIENDAADDVMVLPAENGTMARIVFADGQAVACAAAMRGRAGAASAPADSLRKWRRLCAVMILPHSVYTCSTLNSAAR